jgi:hypothetical protein
VGYGNCGAVTFDQSNYSVRPRMRSLEWWFRQKFTDYDIRSIPASSRGRFSFSWTTGVLRREPAGEEILAVRGREADDWFSKPSYAVIDGSTGSSLASLASRGSDWEILDATGKAIADVIQIPDTTAYCRYVTWVGPHEVCYFTWAQQGWGVSSGELEIEFLAGCNERFDRSLAIALGPLLEEEGRRTSVRRAR